MVDLLLSLIPKYIINLSYCSNAGIDISCRLVWFPCLNPIPFLINILCAFWDLNLAIFLPVLLTALLLSWVLPLAFKPINIPLLYSIEFYLPVLNLTFSYWYFIWLNLLGYRLFEIDLSLISLLGIPITLFTLFWHKMFLLFLFKLIFGLLNEFVEKFWGSGVCWLFFTIFQYFCCFSLCYFVLHLFALQIQY